MTPEQKQRVEQIRERRAGLSQIVYTGCTNKADYEFTVNAPADIDFLLSLVKEQESASASVMAKEIVKTINETAISLAICRHGLIREAEDGETTLPNEAEEEIIQDVLDCLTGEETGCLDPEELDAENCALLMVQDRLNRVVTAMRSACVEKVRRKARQSETTAFHISDREAKSKLHIEANVLYEVAKELKSLSIEKSSEEQKQ